MDEGSRFQKVENFQLFILNYTVNRIRIRLGKKKAVNPRLKNLFEYELFISGLILSLQIGLPRIAEEYAILDGPYSDKS